MYSAFIHYRAWLSFFFICCFADLLPCMQNLILEQALGSAEEELAEGTSLGSKSDNADDREN